MISLRVNSYNTRTDRDMKTVNPDSKHTTKDIRNLINILGFVCLLFAFIFLLFARFIINNRYPETVYIRFHLQLPQMEFITSNIDTSGLDDTQHRTLRVIHQSITMRYTSYDIDDETIDSASYLSQMHLQPLITQSIIYYSMVCNLLYSEHAIGRLNCSEIYK